MHECIAICAIKTDTRTSSKAKMMSEAPGKRDPRWIMLLEDGSYTTIGRFREPDAEDIARLEEVLRQQGRAGWLAVMGQSAYDDGMPEIMFVRALGKPLEGFDAGRERLLVRIGAERGEG